MNCFDEMKDRLFIYELIKNVINEARHNIITTSNCKAAGELVGSNILSYLLDTVLFILLILF